MDSFSRELQETFLLVNSRVLFRGMALVCFLCVEYQTGFTMALVDFLQKRHTSLHCPLCKTAYSTETSQTKFILTNQSRNQHYILQHLREWSLFKNIGAVGGFPCKFGEFFWPFPLEWSEFFQMRQIFFAPPPLNYSNAQAFLLKRVGIF